MEKTHQEKPVEEMTANELWDLEEKYGCEVKPSFHVITASYYFDIPKDKKFPLDAVQCDLCGGHGCPTCEDKGWLPKGHPKGRLCYRDGCGKPIPPDQIAIYCSNQCAMEDA